MDEKELSKIDEQKLPEPQNAEAPEADKKAKVTDPQEAIRREMKRILRGRYDNTEDVIVATDENVVHLSHGVSDGAWRVAILGISCKRRRYVSVQQPDKYIKKVWEALSDMGRAVFLTEAPELTVCLTRCAWCRPGLLVFEMEGNVPTARVYTGRGIFSFISRNHYLKKLEKLMEGSLIRDKLQVQKSTEG